MRRLPADAAFALDLPFAPLDEHMLRIFADQRGY